MNLRWTALFSLCLLSPAVSRGEDSDDVQNIVILADSRPVLVRLHVHIDGKPFRTVHQQAWDECVARLFKYLDANGDGKLSETEASRMPPPIDMAPSASFRPTNVAFNFRVVDTDGDGVVTLAELMAFHREYGLAPLQLHAVPRRAALPGRVDDALFERLDTDHDGFLSREELAAAVSVLAKLDRDVDELLSPQELLGAEVVVATPAAPVRVAPRPPSLPPLVTVTSSADSKANLATALLRRYGAGRERKLGREALGLPADVFARFDRDKDGMLDASELQEFAERTADVELTVRLGNPNGKKPLELGSAPGGTGDPAVIASVSAQGALVIRCGPTLFDLRVNEGAPAQSLGARQRVISQFRAADADAGDNGRLTRKQAISRPFYPNLFSLLDRNGDEALTEAELNAFFDDVQEPHGRALASSPALLISERGSGLFDLLDQNRDGRLSLRELRAAPQLLARLGRERDGKLARADLGASYQLAVGLGRASFAPGSATVSPRELPTLSLTWGQTGLIWFYKMDRNGDGDVSRREFLGTPEMFSKIDTDGDGLISLEEAIRAEALFRK